MKLYNTLTRSKDEFAPAYGDSVKMYVCGPTVYNYFHIGNARCFVVFDMLRRYMEYRGMKVDFVQNFTDVDDKMIKRANEEGTSVKEVADRYIGEYFTDAKGLGIKPATVHPRATENIDEIISIIEKLIENGSAYAAGGSDGNQDVYFATKTFHDYGKLSHMPIEDLENGARIDVTEVKRDPLDFALWKAYKEGEPSWDSPWGKGRPGWHIECSAMARKYLGKSIDIHCGGQDLTFPHHENEIAQSECANCAPFSRFWVHNGYINVNNEKMSKSKNNFFTVRDIAAQYGYLPIRFFLLSAHYRSPVNFSEEIIGQAQSGIERINNSLRDAEFYLGKAADESIRADENTAVFDECKNKFISEMDDDFNTADGIAAIFELVREVNRGVSANASKSFVKYGYDMLRELTELMGFIEEVDAGIDTAEIEALIEERTAAKKAKNYARADEIRKNLADMGVILEDTPKGTKYKINK